MSTNLTYTDIANMALDWCGASLSIQDIDEKQNPDAILCARNLPHAIQTELDSYEWAFARRVITPVKDESPDRQIPGYICYSLPDDFSRLSMYQFFDYYYRLTHAKWRGLARFLMEKIKMRIRK